MDAATQGLALPDHSGALRTLQHRTQAPPQKADGFCSSRHSPGSAMVAVAQDRRRRRFQIRGARSNRHRSSTCLPRHEVRLDASLFEPAPERRPGQNGRPPKKGRRLPKLSELREEEKMHWIRLSMPYWYG
jgi:hypothetical protein